MDTIDEKEFCKLYIKDAINCLTEAFMQTIHNDMSQKEYSMILDGILPSMCVVNTRLININIKQV